MVVERPRWSHRQSHGSRRLDKECVCLDERLKRAAPFLDTSLGSFIRISSGFEASG